MEVGGGCVFDFCKFYFFMKQEVYEKKSLQPILNVYRELLKNVYEKKQYKPCI